MQKEKLAVIGLVIIVVAAVSGYLLVDENIRNAIFGNLFGKEEPLVLANDDSFTFYRNTSNNVADVVGNDKYTNLSNLEIEIITEPSNGIVNVSEKTVTYSPTSGFLGDDSFTYKIIDENGKTSQATVTIKVEIPLVELGDCVDVSYTGMYENGTVFDTNIEEVAKQWGLYNETLTYEPVKVFVDPNFQYYPPEGYENYSASFVPGFLNGLVGMEDGEKKNVTVPPEDAYGIWNESLAEMFGMGTYPLVSVITSEITENKTALVESFPGINLTEGAIFDYGEVAFEQEGVLNASIVNITDENVTYKLLPENGSSVKLPLFNWYVTFIVENDTAFTMKSAIEEGHTFSIESYYGSMHFKVISVNEKDAKLAMNIDAPDIKFIGQTLVFELEAVKIYKTSVQLES